MASIARSGLSAVVQEVAERVRRLVRLEAELAAVELKQKAASLASGVAVLVFAAVLALFALGFGLAAAAVALATFLDTWLALLIVTAALLVTAVFAGLLGRSLLRRAGPPVPERAIAEAKVTGEVLRGSHGG